MFGVALLRSEQMEWRTTLREIDKKPFMKRATFILREEARKGNAICSATKAALHSFALSQQFSTARHQRSGAGNRAAVGGHRSDLQKR